MKYNYKKDLPVCFAFCVFIISAMILNGCAGGHVYGEWGRDSKPKSEQHQVKYSYKYKHKHKHNGPPAHAPAHGYRAKHQYRYYSSCKVYHDTGRGLYFYLKGDNWEVGASLPSHLKEGLGEFVTIELDTDKPYVHNEEHIKNYPPKNSQRKKQKKMAKNRK